MRTFFLLVILAFLAAPAYSKTASKQELIKKEKKLEDVKKQIREEKKSVKVIAEKETNVLGELDEINKSLVVKREELKKVEASIYSIQKNINSASQNISKIEKEIKALSLKLKARMKAMYKMRRGETMRVLFSSDSSKDLGRRHKYLTMIMDNDTDLMSGYEAKLADLQAEKQKLAVLYSDMANSKREITVKKGETEGLQRTRLALLAGIKQEKEKKTKLIKELEQAAEELSSLIDRLSASDEPPPADYGAGFASMKGRLRMPVSGNIVSVYGKVKHPRFQTVTFNNGIMIEAPVGTPVRNTYEGKIIYAGWLKGYGQMMIIDHKGGYYTLFAHLSKFIKEKGDTVKGGEEVALVGDTGPTAA
ncbi:MAG: peptidoglycan DD-metalloendopeptidase family protein [Deltaproteobacteria bacterium]|nr:peptidoglycan DD-metalloendopeptidase family protein [Deltaproteobacteria bacterium]